MSLKVYSEKRSSIPPNIESIESTNFININLKLWICIIVQSSFYISYPFSLPVACVTSEHHNTSPVFCRSNEIEISGIAGGRWETDLNAIIGKSITLSYQPHAWTIQYSLRIMYERKQIICTRVKLCFCCTFQGVFRRFWYQGWLQSKCIQNYLQNKGDMYTCRPLLRRYMLWTVT